MIINPQVPLHRLVLSLSEALDHVHPSVADHQQRTAYIAIRIARAMGFDAEESVNMFRAAALHDIGLIGAENRVKMLHLGQLERFVSHPEIGYQLLRNNPLFAPAAEIIRHHHVRWADGMGAEHEGNQVPIASHLLTLADHVEVSIDRNSSVLHQAGAIIDDVLSLSGERFHPKCVEAFREVAQAEAFWLDATSQRIYAVLLNQINWPTLTIDEVALGPIAGIFARVVDAASPWTAVHSAGVSATAVALAKRLHFSPREIHLMRAAGYLHDLGKLSVPTAILDKPGGLTREEVIVVKGHTYHTYRILETIGGMPRISEWAAFHHERLDGNGYPFRHAGDDLTLGSRIMAVADVFTALTESRPYREGMSPTRCMAVLTQMSESGGLDVGVVQVVRRDYEEVDAARCAEQSEYGSEQVRIMEVIHGEPALQT